MLPKIFTFLFFSPIIFWQFSFSQIWTQKASYPGLSGLSGFVINGKGYLGTGYNGSTMTRDFWEYDPLTNGWTQKADFGGTARDGAVGFSIGSKGYLGLGTQGYPTYNFVKDFWEYDSSMNNWTPKADFPGLPRYTLVGFTIGTKGYVGTGWDQVTPYFSDFYEYNQSSDTWSQKNNFTGTPRQSAVGFELNGKAYVGTGFDGSNTNDFWEYTPFTNSWTQKADFGGLSRFGASGFSLSGKGYIGLGGNGATKYNDFWEFNPIANSWSQKQNFGGTPRDCSFGFSIDNCGYIGPGIGSSGQNLYDFWSFCICSVPEAGFSVNAASFCIDSIRNFNNSSLGATSYFWNFGDGNMSSLVSPTHIYSDTGDFYVFLVATSSCGSDTSFQTISVNGGPKADFSMSLDSCGASNVVFNNNSSGATSCFWNFGDGDSSTSVNPSHTYSNSGTFNILLVSFNSCGNDSSYQSLAVNGGLTSLFSAPDISCVNSLISFINNSTPGSLYSWYFGDGDSSLLSSPTHTYSDSGLYTVILVALDSCGSDSSFHLILIMDSVNAGISAPEISCVNTSISFINNSTEGSSFLWDFGNGDTSSLFSPTHSYSDTGLFDIILVAIGPCGTDSAFHSISVIGTAMAAFSAPPLSCMNNIISFTNNSIGAISHYWNFGDGNTSSLISPNHSYSDTGLFNIFLIVSGPCNTDTSLQSIYIGAGVEAGFTAPSFSCLDKPISFINSSTGATTYLWNFGDGSMSSLISPIHSFSDSGLFEIFLLATNSCGTDTFVSSVLSSPKEFPYAISEDTAIDAGSQILLASGQGLAYSWSTGETTNEIAVSPTKETTYYVTITDAGGCLAVDSVSVRILSCSIFIPTIFSPNGDGRNDKISVHTKSIREFNFFIYDRLGEQVFESHDTHYGWDGIYNTELINTAVFVYYIEATCKNDEIIRERGNITLIK